MRSDGAREARYDVKYFPAIAAAEDGHFWFRHRNAVIGRLLARVWRQRGRPGARVLEAGCGTGNTLRVLERVCTGAVVVGLEPFVEGLDFARQRTAARLVCGRLEQLPFRSAFSIVGLFDVLEHIPADGAALESLRAQLEPHGTLIMTVPAHQSLWGRFDEASGHVRRYSSDGLGRVLTASGFGVEYLSPFMLPLFPLVWVSRRIADRQARGDAVERELTVPGALNAGLRALLRLEEPWVNGTSQLPFGTSIVAVARKV